MIDLRSDTLTKPTREMLEAMMIAEVGDDVFDGDPTVNALQDKVAKMFGMEAALFCPSGTMTNQIAIRLLTQPQDEIICDKGSHVYNYEAGGVAYNSLVSVCLLDGDRGRINARQVEENIRPIDIHAPRTSLVCIENTMNKGGGSCYDFEEIIKIRKICDQYDLKLHLDGARIFNALAVDGIAPAEYGRYCDTISICLSKGLGAPVGSLLLSNKENISRSKRIRKVFGGGMRQAGYLAAAGIYALDHHIHRLKDDHHRAGILGKVLEELDFVEYVLPVETNIVIFKLAGNRTANDFLSKLKEKGLLGIPFGKQEVRFVTHLHFNDDQLEQAVNQLKKI